MSKVHGPVKGTGNREQGTGNREQGIGRPRARAALYAGAVLAALIGSTALAQTPGKPLPDAVIELWEQSYTLRADGGQVYHEKKYVRLNDPRANGEFGDWRITFDAGTDQLNLITARSRRPDGTFRDLPTYACVDAAPGNSAGWPAFAGIKQQILVMAGIEPGCVLEVEYEITRAPGAATEFAADLRLDDAYPIQTHTITITTPDKPIQPVIRGIEVDAGAKSSDASAHGGTSWTFRDVRPHSDDPQTPPWYVAEPRFAFSRAPSPEWWVEARLARVAAAATAADAVTAAAAKWTEGASDTIDRVRLIQEKLAATFNFVDVEPALRPAKPRSAQEVLRDNYGSADDAAAVFLALVRAANVPAELALVVDDERWLSAAPQDSMIAAFAVTFRDADGRPQAWEARRGRVVRSGRWAGVSMMSVAENKVTATQLPAWDAPDDSDCRVSIDAQISADGNLTGTATLRLSGLFLTADELRKADAQKSRAAAIVSHALAGVTVESATVRTLGDAQFEVEAKFKSDAPLARVASRYELRLSDDRPSAIDAPLPLSRSERSAPARLAGAFEDRVDVKVTWPKAWRVDASPTSAALVSGGWGRVEQTATVKDNELRLSRTIRIARRELPASETLLVRGLINTLRTDAARTLMLKPE